MKNNIDDLLKNINGNITIIQEEIIKLNKAECIEIYNKYKKSTWIAIINYFLGGFGIANFIQGDKKGGFISLIGFSGSIIFGIIGAMILKQTLLILISASIASGFYLFALIRSIIFPLSYNKKIKNILNLK